MNDVSGHHTGLFDCLATRIRSAKLRTIGSNSTTFGEGASTFASSGSVSLAPLVWVSRPRSRASWVTPLALVRGVVEELGIDRSHVVLIRVPA